MQMLLIAAAATQALGTFAEGRSREQQYTAQAKANDYNAAVLQQRADNAASVGNAREESVRRTNRMEAGRRAAAIGQSGLGSGGSNADVNAQSATLAELDALNIRYEGQLEAHSLRAQASLEGWQGDVNRAFRSTARRGTYIATAGSLLSGASRAYAGGVGGK